MKNQTRLPDPITVTHVTAGNVVAVGTFHVYAAATTWSWKINHSITPNHDYLTQNNATIDIWLLKSNDLSNLGIIIDKKNCFVYRDNCQHYEIRKFIR